MYGSPLLIYSYRLNNFFFIDRHLVLIFYYFFLYTVFVCKFRPQESQSDVLGDLRRMISLVVGSYIFGMPPLLLPGLEPASPGALTVLTIGYAVYPLNQTWIGKYEAIPTPE
jgi:hypothetical protein